MSHSENAQHILISRYQTYGGQIYKSTPTPRKCPLFRLLEV